MKTSDVLADEVNVRRPVAREQAALVGKSQYGNVVDEGIEPHIEDMIRVPGNRDAPFEPRTRDAHVLEPAFYEAHDFVLPHLGDYEVGAGIDMREQRYGIFRQCEEVILLLDPSGRHLVRGAVAIDQILFLVESLT